jgi:hypothetical protein
MQAWHLPTDPVPHRGTPSYLIAITILNETAEIRLENGIVRPPNRDDPRVPLDPVGQAAAQWIDWQVRAFQEAGHIPQGDADGIDATTRGGLTRRSWQTAAEVWLKSDTSSARMALVVQLSREDGLHRALASISAHPRRILQRYRAEAPLHRIQELDSACIREFARRPGMTAAEKAGPRQRLLTVLRREQRDTFENRIACWVMDAANELAREYAIANASLASDEKVRIVRRFQRQLGIWRASEPLVDVAGLPQHADGPNYPLQFEPRYRLVWKAYLRVRREKWVQDDAWTWQRVLWADAGRQLLGCFLHERFDPAGISTPFYRSESRQGCWTAAPVAPGPFRTRWGNCLVFDSRDLDRGDGSALRHWIERPPFPGAQYAGASGCDQVMFWPERDRALFVWHFYHAALTGLERDLQPILARCGRALEQLGGDMRRFAQAAPRIGGVLIVPDLARGATLDDRTERECVALEPGPRLVGGGAVNALCLPPDVDTWSRFVPDLLEGLAAVVEDLMDRA